MSSCCGLRFAVLGERSRQSTLSGRLADEGPAMDRGSFRQASSRPNGSERYTCSFPSVELNVAAYLADPFCQTLSEVVARHGLRLRAGCGGHR